MDVVDRSVDPETGIIRTERIIGCTQKAPTWIIKVRLNPARVTNISGLTLLQQVFGGSDDAFVREICFVDPRTQEATISSVNMSLAQFATCNEFIKYSPAPDGRTTFTQTAEIEAHLSGWRMLADKFEGWLVQRFEQNAQLGKVGFSEVLRTLQLASEQQLARS